MATSVQIQTARIAADGQVNIVFADGSGQTWPNIDDFVAENLTNELSDPSFLKRIALHIIAVRIGRITNPAQVEGKTLSFDPTITNVLRVT